MMIEARLKVIESELSTAIGSLNEATKNDGELVMSRVEAFFCKAAINNALKLLTKENRQAQ